MLEVGAGLTFCFASWTSSLVYRPSWGLWCLLSSFKDLDCIHISTLIHNLEALMQLWYCSSKVVNFIAKFAMNLCMLIHKNCFLPKVSSCFINISIHGDEECQHLLALSHYLPPPILKSPCAP